MRIDFGMPCIRIYASRNLTNFLEPVFSVRRTDGYCEYLSTATEIKAFFSISSGSDTAKFNCNFSLGEEKIGSRSEVLAVLDDLSFLVSCQIRAFYAHLTFIDSLMILVGPPGVLSRLDHGLFSGVRPV